MRKKPGFTLIELMIVIAIIAVVALIAIPNLLSSRLVANETATVGTLRSIASSQAEFQARQIVAQDNDGLGEYGFLQELAGTVIPRGGAAALARRAGRERAALPEPGGDHARLGVGGG